ncbi:TetR family transcriptional regulator [Microlunatus elymi]|uniref:TetR family transcriptional regulator n=1 Tax=Microlunatus elymi TaxID=2596828 RepID=A0A516Q3L7_9ACTN|nr:TetR/AcrR family transcriptional regulator C-terminal domain-containing protein [Microlunatus elymi]QDP98020.1 TetR family transcriptional regulator [Microlunatus elymi]
MPLDRDVVIRTALKLMDDDGLDALTLRKIASALDVKAPALYWHFQNKQQLLDEMATSMLRAATEETVDEGLPWPDQLRRQAGGFRRMLLSHRDGARLFGGTYLTDPSPVTAGEPLLRALIDVAGDLRSAVMVMRTLNCFVIGFVLEEQGVVDPSGRRDPRYDPAVRAERLDPDRFPLSSASSEYVWGDLDASFAAGVELIIGGFAAQLDQPPASKN